MFSGEQGKQSGPGDKNSQYSLPEVHVDDVLTVLPNARFPVGGKQPIVLLHSCALVCSGNELRSISRRAVANSVDFMPW